MDYDKGCGPSSLLHLIQRQVLDGVYKASRPDCLSAPFSLGGTLGRLPVKLAVGLAPVSGQVEQAAVFENAAGPSAGAEEPAVAAAVVEFPAGGERDLAVLLNQCETVVDESHQTALALPAARLFTHHLELSGAMAAAHRLLLPATGWLSSRLHALNASKQGGFSKPHRNTPRDNPGFVSSLVVCLPVAHAGGVLRVEHSGRSVTYDWGAGATAGEVQWAAFFPDCLQEVLPVTSGTQVTLTYELFAHPETSSSAEPVRALTDGASELARVLGAALNSSSFMVNGGRIGFACQHAYPQSLMQGNTREQDVRSMLKGADAAVLHTLSLLGVPTKLVRVWDLEVEEEDVYYLQEGEGQEGRIDHNSVMYVSDLRPTELEPGFEPREESCICNSEILQQDMGAELDPSITWLGGRGAFPQWTLGGMCQFYACCNQWTEQYYCTLGIVAEVPPFDSRPTADREGWAGREGPASCGAAGESSKGKRRRSGA